MDAWTVIRSLILVAAGVCGARSRKRRKLERLGELFHIGKAQGFIFPWLPLMEIVSVALGVGPWLAAFLREGKQLECLGLGAFLVLSVAFMGLDLARERRRVLVYRYGIELNGVEIGFDKMTRYEEDEDGVSVVERRRKRPIRFSIVEDVAELPGSSEKNKGIIGRARDADARRWATLDAVIARNAGAGRDAPDS